MIFSSIKVEEDKLEEDSFDQEANPVEEITAVVEEQEVVPEKVPDEVKEEEPVKQDELEDVPVEVPEEAKDDELIPA